MTVSPDDVALAAVLGAVYLGALWLRHQNQAAERKHKAAQANADRRNALAVAKADGGEL